MTARLLDWHSWICFNPTDAVSIEFRAVSIHLRIDFHVSNDEIRFPNSTTAPIPAILSGELMPDRSTPITIVGAGALGQALTRSIHAAGRPLHAIVSRSPDRGGALAEEVNSRRVEEPMDPAGDAVILCVPDDHIASVVQRLKLSPGSILVHCAGARGLE